jgi:hypothetical protein
VVGTPTYMSPEQAVGKPATALSDQYSIGAILYRCVTGRVPHGVLPRPRTDRADIPEELEGIVLRAMDARPEGRFPSVFDLGRALEPFASPAGRAKWKGYYTTPPIPLRPAFTGPIPFTASPKQDPAATAVLAYDFRAHERTTRVDQGAPLEGTTTTIDPQGPSTVGAESRTRIDIIADEVSVVSDRSDAAARPEAPLSSISVGAKRALATQRVLVAGALALAMVIVGATWGVRAWRSRSVMRAPAPPAWTEAPSAREPEKQIVPATVAPSARSAAAPSPASENSSTPKHRESPEPGQPARASEDAGPATGQAAPPRKHRKRRNSTVQYTKDGVPLLPPE